MKKEELFDLLGQIDDKYLEEAMYDDYDPTAPVEIRAVKTRVTPIKIIVPIAACLAVVAAGSVILNRDKLTTMRNDDISSASNSTQNDHILTAADREFIAQCKSIVINESELIAQNGAVWQSKLLDVDFDGEDEYLIYPTIDNFTVADVGVRVFKNTAEGVQDLGAFGLESYRIDLDGIYRYPKEGVEAYYYYSDRIYSPSNDGGLIESIQMLQFLPAKNKVNDTSEMRKVTEYGPSDEIVSEKFYVDNYNNAEISETEFYKRWFDFPNMPAIMGDFTADDIDACKKKIHRKYSGLNESGCLFKEIRIDSSAILLIDPHDGIIPRKFAFKKTDDGVEEIGVLNGSFELDDIKLYNPYDPYNERYWYYATSSESFDLNDELNSKQAEVVKIELDGDNISEHTYLSYLFEYEDNIPKCSFKINGRDVSEERFIDRWSQYLNMEIDADELSEAGFRLKDYPQIDLDEVPKLDDYAPVVQIERQNETIQKATLSSLKYGEYEISLLGRYIFTSTLGDDNILNSCYLSLGLSKNGTEICRTDTCTIGAQGGNNLRKDKLDQMLEVAELSSGSVVIVKYYTDSGIKAAFVGLKNDELIPLDTNTGEYSSQITHNITLPEKYHFDDNSLIDDETGKVLFSFSF